MESRRDAVRRWEPGVLALGVLVLSLSITVRTAFFLDTETYVDSTSGVWTAHATDLAGGTLYRHLEENGLYGGSRYMPLFFSMHALLIRCGARPLVSGLALSVCCGLLLAIAVYRLLRVTGLPPVSAAAAAALSLATVSSGRLLCEVRCDLLSAALVVAATALCVGVRVRAIWAAVLLTLAFTAKASAVYAAVACAAGLVAEGKRRAAAILVATTLGLDSVAVLLIERLSDGRFLECFRANSSAGASLQTVLGSPAALWRVLQKDPVASADLGLAVLALAASRVTGGVAAPLPIVALWAWSMVALLAIFSTPGTYLNHLAEPAAISLALTACVVLHPRCRPGLRAASTILATGLCVGMAFVFLREIPERTWSPNADALHRIVSLCGPRDRPVLSTDPMVPIARDERPVLLDAFAYAQYRDGLPRDATIEARLARREFGAVVLRGAATPGKSLGLGARLPEVLVAHYVPAGRVLMYWVYVPAP